jgi:hypothetical protein
MKKQSKEVPVQKGKIDSNPMTMKQMNQDQKVRERREQIKESRRGQTTDFHSPRR